VILAVAISLPALILVAYDTSGVVAAEVYREHDRAQISYEQILMVDAEAFIGAVTAARVVVNETILTSEAVPVLSSEEPLPYEPQKELSGTELEDFKAFYVNNSDEVNQEEIFTSLPWADEMSMNKVFELNCREKTLYNNYLSSHDISVLSGEPAITVGKIFIMLALNEQLEACYELHVKDSNLIPKEQYIEEGTKLLSIMDAVTRRSFVNIEFFNIEDKEFIELTETTGYTEHRFRFGASQIINFIKNDNDIWLIQFLNL
jgi:hypothetical protein